MAKEIEEYNAKVIEFSTQCVNLETETFFDQDFGRYIRYVHLIEPLTFNNHILN
jgi:hypothetical protein|tara:strand:+ start:128 stop:289 length:162 start_codon:yes stop_codon:yes gene_type:complete